MPLERTGRHRKVIIGAAAAVLVLLWYFVRAEGRPRATGAEREILLTEAPSWSHPPGLADLVSDPGAVYILLGAAPGAEGKLDTVRFGMATGERRREIRGREGLELFSQATEAGGVARVVFRGVVLPRPRFHLFKFPYEGRGPGFSLVKTYTGIARVVAGTGARERTLLTRWLFNSPDLRPIEDIASLDPKGLFIACRWSSPEGWRVWIFGRTPVERRNAGLAGSFTSPRMEVS
jgi:hypothetical protein